MHVHVCYIVRHFDSWLGHNIFSAAFGHVPAKLSLETHPWVQIDSMIAQEPVRKRNEHGVEARAPCCSKMSTPRKREHGGTSAAAMPGSGGAPKTLVFHRKA